MLSLSKNQIAGGMFLLICLLLYTKASIGTPLFSADSFSYVVLMGKNILSADYWRAAAGMFRPLSVPLLYSLFGSATLAHQLDIIYAQTWLLFFSWVMFACSLSQLIACALLRWFMFVAVTLAMFGRHYLHLNQYLLSDAFSLSLLLIWFALVLYAVQLYRWVTCCRLPARLLAGLLLLALTILAMFARDANGLLMLFGMPLLWRSLRRKSLPTVIICCSVILGLMACWYATSGGRAQVAMRAIITGVILPDKEKTDFFIAHGMPGEPWLLDDPQLRRSWDFVTLDTKTFYPASYKTAHALSQFLSRATGVYFQYLLSHPNYMFERLVDNYPYIITPSFFARMDDDSMATFRYGGRAAVIIPPDPAYLSVIDAIPVLLLSGTAVLAIGFHVVLLIRRDALPVIGTAGFFILSGGLCNAILSFNGDFCELGEMQRHAYAGSVFFKIGCVALIAGFIDHGMQHRKRNRRSDNSNCQPPVTI